MACITFVECSDRVTDVIPQAQRFGRAAEVVLDRALDRSVIGGFSNIGYAVRSRNSQDLWMGVSRDETIAA